MTLKIMTYMRSFGILRIYKKRPLITRGFLYAALLIHDQSALHFVHIVYSRLPIIITILFSKSDIEKMINDTVEHMKEYIESNIEAKTSIGI